MRSFWMAAGCLISCGGLLALAACADLTIDPLHVDAVTVEGDARAGNFHLVITGQGFWPAAFVYDLSSAHGVTQPSAYGVDVFGPDEEMIPSDRVEVQSPRSMRARISLALAPGGYGLRVRGAGTDTFLVARAFDVPRPSNDGKADAGTAPGAFDVPDAGRPASGGDLDAGYRQDSGVLSPRPFMGSYAYRSAIALMNPSTGQAPERTTFVITIPHAQLVAAGRSKADGSDLALYFREQRLPHAFDDPVMLGTDGLRMIARLPEALAAGASLPPDGHLDLYFGDPAAANSPQPALVFEVSERFVASPSGWTFRDWVPCAYDRPAMTTGSANGTYCMRDTTANPTRSTLSSPVLGANAGRALSANLRVEVSFHLFGAMASTNDLLYFAFGPDPTSYVQALQPDSADYVESSPDATLTFRENNGTDRTANGFRLPPTPSNWKRVRIRSRPPFEQPSLHFRYVSSDATSNATTVVVVDDVSARIALEPELVGPWGPVEARP